jgi:hypothetical protein
LTTNGNVGGAVAMFDFVLMRNCKPYDYKHIVDVYSSLYHHPFNMFAYPIHTELDWAIAIGRDYD